MIRNITKDAEDVNFFIMTDAFNDIRKLDYETNDVDDKNVIKYIVGTIKQISRYGQFINDDTLQLCVETLEYVLRFDNQAVNNLDVLFTLDFTQGLGYLIRKTSENADVISQLHVVEGGITRESVNLNTGRLLHSLEGMPSPELLRSLQDTTAQATTPAVVPVTGETQEVPSEDGIVTAELIAMRKLLKKVIVIKNR